MKESRREFLRGCGSAVGGVALASPADPQAIVIDPTPRFEISPYLYMQFMEPLGATDSSVEAAWDYDKEDWRRDFVGVVKDLAPDAIRWGGIHTRYYKWREGVGAPKKRPISRNYHWGGVETNRVGTHEFIDLCRRVGAEPIIGVNFLSDGQKAHWRTADGQNRAGDAREAADWVSYCNDPDDRERRANGFPEPCPVTLWQIGNETSYSRMCFNREEAIAHTIEFARAMRQRDPSIKLIGWGDREPGDPTRLWAGELLKRAGEYLDLVAIHMMGMRPKAADTLLRGLRYQQDPEAAWQELLALTEIVESRVREAAQVLRDQKAKAGLAITEGHLSLTPHNANPILYEWLSAVYHARSLNIYQRNGDLVRVATAADFEGTRWTVNAVMLEVPRHRTYLMPVGSIMRLFKRCNGRHGVSVKAGPAGLDIAASRAGNKLYLHVANLNYSRPVQTTLVVQGMAAAGGKVHEIAPGQPRDYVSADDPDVFRPKEKPLPSGPDARWSFPPTSVSAVELDLAAS